MATNWWIVAVPNDGVSPQETFNSLQRNTASDRNQYGEIYRLDIPPLMVGTLDALISLSDDLVRTDLVIESVAKRIERQYSELTGEADESLDIAGVSLTSYLERFSWDYANYPHRRPLIDVVGLIQQKISVIENELKQLSNSHVEKNQSLAALRRKKQGNLSVVNLEDVITDEMISLANPIDTDYLVTLYSIVPKNQENSWLQNYTNIGSEIAAYGNPDWKSNRSQLGKNDGRFGPNIQRRTVVGSPVVPGTSKKIYEDSEFALYTVTILRGHFEAGVEEGGEFQSGQLFDYIEPFIKEARERRFIIKKYVHNPNKTDTSQDQLKTAELEVQRIQAGMKLWCRGHYGESIIAWIHVKVIRAFVESVLRYGLPVDFTAVIYKVGRKPKQLQDKLNKMYSHLKGSNLMLNEDDEEEDENEYFPYVCLKFNA